MTLYEINGKGADGLDLSVKCVADGQLVEVEREIPMTGLPAEAQPNLHTLFPDGTVLSAEAIEVHFYEVRVRQGDKTEEVRVNASGRIHRENDEGEDEERDEHGETHHR